MEVEDNYQDVSKITKTKWYHINVKMMPAKAVYVFSEAAKGCIVPFLNPFYVSLGLTAADAGMIAGINSIFAILSGAIWGRLSDFTGRRKLIFVVLTLGSILAVFPLPWIAKSISKKDHNVTCLHNSTKPHFDKHSIHHHNMDCFRLLNPRVLFFLLLAITGFYKLFFNGWISFIEGIVMNVVTNSESKATFGTQKMFSPIGFALGTQLSGLAIDHYSSRSLSQYSAAFYVFLPFIVLTLPIGYLMVGQAKFEEGSRKEKSLDKTGEAVNIKEQLKMIFRNWDNILILFSVFVSKMLQHVFYQFSFLFMHDELHLKKTTMSYSIVICMASELIVYPLSSKLIKLLGGNVPCIIIGISSYFPRYLAISYAESAALMLPIQLFHGIGVSLSWTCFMLYVNEVFPKEIVMTVIMIMTTSHLLLSGTVAGIISGVVYHKYGGRILFRGASVLAATWGVVLTTYFGVRYLRRNKKSSSSFQPVRTGLDNAAFDKI